MIHPPKTRECPYCGEQAEYMNQLSMLYGWHYACAAGDGCGATFWWGLEQQR